MTKLVYILVRLWMQIRPNHEQYFYLSNAGWEIHYEMQNCSDAIMATAAYKSRGYFSEEQRAYLMCMIQNRNKLWLEADKLMHIPTVDEVRHG